MRSIESISEVGRCEIYMGVYTVVDNLKKRGFLAEYCQDAETAKARVLEIIDKQSVGIGGSATVRDLGLYETLQEKGNAVYWHWKVERSEVKAERKRALEAEVYLASTNAILEDGRLVNIDGTGNRAAGLIYGPETVILIAGKNKLVSGKFDDAIDRIKREACAKNARRQGFETPCAVTGVCADCHSNQRMCCVTYIHEAPCKSQKAFYVLLVDENLGL